MPAVALAWCWIGLSDEAVVDPIASAVSLPKVRVVNARLRVGSFTAAGSAITLTQCDATTCGATAVQAARLLLGAPATATAPPPKTARPALALRDALAAQQRRVQHAMNRRAGGPLGPLPWTRHLGSTPWAVAAQMTRLRLEAGLPVGAYSVGRVDDRGPQWPAVIAGLRSLLADGVPVVLLTGGPLLRYRSDSGRRIRRLLRNVPAAPAIPRHYVLAVPWDAIGRKDPGAGQAHIYEPSSGTVRALDLLAPRRPSGPGPRELGYWPRVLAVIAPSPFTEES
ncbi:hypothetical protein [Actinomyces qiguomingii]|uniref:hypothetical protein n=1 Tax=Actinomyces qiguomingii TaxID=2057800 RepID=UPI001E4AF8CA|nr:hypothetical protein [Actinomyces qiguomingii]